jgi:hypothetical protein
MEFWHTKHSCGHSVYWNNPRVAVLMGDYPCPWCGGETGNPAPDDVQCVSADHGLLGFRELLPDGRAPVPDDLLRDGIPNKIYHRADNSCCG